MNFWKRSYLNIIRNPVKSIIFFFLVFTLATLLSGAISIQNAINVTKTNILAQYQPVATLFWNVQEADQWEFPSQEMIEDVGNLPNVKDFDFSISASLMSRELRTVTPNLFPTLIPDFIKESDEENTPIYIGNMLFSFKEMGIGYVDSFEVRGIHNPNPIDVQAEVISLTSGRFMNQEELDSGASVAVVSELFAEANNLTIGSKIILENMVHDAEKLREAGDPWFASNWHLDEFILAKELVEFTIIGLFDVNREFFHHNDQLDNDTLDIFSDYIMLYNRIYAPGKKTLELADFFKELDPSEAADWFSSLVPLFLLDDFRNFSVFSEQAEAVLPQFWEVREISLIGFESILTSMNIMENIATSILWTTIGATIIILCLLLLLYLRDRKNEIGIYRALGEKRGKIIIQILLEVLSISIVAISLALFSGNILSSILSEHMLKQDLIRQEQESQMIPLYQREFVATHLRHFKTRPLPLEEMLEIYDVSLNSETVFVFYSSALLTILISAIIPVRYILRLNAKELLM